MIRSMALITTFYSLFSCAGAARQDSNTRYEQLAKEKFGIQNVILLNTSGTFALCYRSETDLAGGTRSFFVFEIASDSVVLEETMAKGSVAWLDDHRISVTKELGIITKDGQKGTDSYVYDTRSKSKTDVKDEN